MSLRDRFRRLFRRRSPARRGLDSLGSEDIRSIVEESLEETEATSELVERALDTHERARDLVRQGLFEEALARFHESLEAWEAQAAMCRQAGFKNLWKGKPAQVGREMEDLRITHLDVLDIDSFRYLARRARLRHNQLAKVLQLAGGDVGASESDVYRAFPADQQEEIRTILFHAERRGWLVRESTAKRYYLRTSSSAPDISPED